MYKAVLYIINIYACFLANVHIKMYIPIYT